MNQPVPARPRVSRETRLLLLTILISVAALWALARIRFPGRPATPNPVPPLLTQLAAPPAFDDLASEVSKLEARLVPSLAVVEVSGSPLVALRVRDDVGAALIGAAAARHGAPERDGLNLLGFDAASGLAIVRVPGSPAPDLKPWSPDALDRPRYLFVSDASRDGASVTPVFIGRLHATKHPAWPEDVWLLPARTRLATGDLVFTIDGALAGLVVAHSGMPVLVPGATVLREVDRLLNEKNPPVAGSLGVEVQPLTASVSAATGARAGVIVVSVDPGGPAAKLAVMDVIEAIDGDAILSPEDWNVRIARLAPNQSIALRVRRGGETRDVALTAAVPAAPNGPLALGLRMRTLTRAGAEVVHVAERSAAARAGIRAGDIITAVGDVSTPTPSQVSRAFAATPDDRPLLVAVTRGNTHHVLVLQKK